MDERGDRAGNAVPDHVAEPPPEPPRNVAERDPAPHPQGAARVIARLAVGVVQSCLRYRVTGLAAEAAFFALLSLPPLVLGVVASLGYFADVVGQDTIDRVNITIIDLARTVFTDQSIEQVVLPTLSEVRNARSDIVSIGFVLALWSGSRALNVYVDTITIMYGLGGRRGIVRTRILSFSLYVVALILGVIGLPLVLAGPELVAEVIPDSLAVLNGLYWPVVILVSISFLTTLYHLSVPVRTAWLADLPGAALALLIWILGGVALRATLDFALGGSSLYGPLTAPIAVLLWLFVTALAVLVGAALNSEIDRAFPAPATWRARRQRADERAAGTAAAAENPVTPVERAG